MIKTIKHFYNVAKNKLRDIGIDKKRSPEWSKIKKIFIKKNPFCAMCSSKTRLNVHHKKPFHLFPELELNESNLITLCMSRKECHFKIGHGSNYRKYCENIDKYIYMYKNEEKTFKEICELAKKESVD